MAGVALHARIIEHTLTDGRDQSHLSVLHYSRSVAVPDRTEYILALERGDRSLPNPALGMADVFDGAFRALPAGSGAVGGVPCNTFHAPVIFDFFLAELKKRHNPVRVVHMLDETVKLLSERTANAGERPVIGVLSTTGMRRSGLYDRLLERGGFRILYVDEREQEELHRAIYDPEWGIKAASPPDPRAVETVAALAKRLIGRGAAAVIPGCTELPLVLPGEWLDGIPLVDPVTALARALIRGAAPEKLRKLS